MTPRRDELPEHRHFRDTGCSWYAHCLSCPFVVCRFDLPVSEQHRFNARERREADARADEVRQLRAQGLTVTEVIARLGVTRRTVFRYLRRAKAA